MKKFFTFIIATLLIFSLSKPELTVNASENNIDLDKNLKSISINSAIEEIKVFGKSDRNYIEVASNDFNIELGQNIKIEQKNSMNILDNSIKIYLTSDLEELHIDTKHTDLKLFDVNINKLNIKNANGDNKLFNSQAKNIEIKEENGEIVIEKQTNLENLIVNSSATDVKLFSVNADKMELQGNDNKIIFTESHSPKIIFDTQKSKIEGQLLTKGNNFNFVDSKDKVKDNYSIFVDKNKNNFSVEFK